MTVTLARSGVCEVVGDALVLLDTTTTVYTLPLSSVDHYCAESRTLTLSGSATAVLSDLHGHGLIERPAISRRTLMGSAGVVIGGGLAALSLPMAAAASSIVVTDNNGNGADTLPRLEASGDWKFASGVDGSEVDININLTDYIDDLDTESLESWTLTILGTPFVLGDDAGEPSFDGDVLVIELETHGVLSQLGSELCRTVAGGVLEFTDSHFTVEAVLTAGDITIHVTLEYRDRESDCRD